MENYVNRAPFPVILSVSEGSPGFCNTFRDSSTPAPPALRMTFIVAACGTSARKRVAIRTPALHICKQQGRPIQGLPKDRFVILSDAVQMPPPEICRRSA